MTEEPQQRPTGALRPAPAASPSVSHTPAGGGGAVLAKTAPDEHAKSIEDAHRFIATAAHIRAAVRLSFDATDWGYVAVSPQAAIDLLASRQGKKTCPSVTLIHWAATGTICYIGSVT